MKEFTKDELSKNNGQNGQPAYVAFQGKVYDVSKVFQNGEHGGAQAGTDLTNSFGSIPCPHEEAVFGNFPEVGTLSQ